VNPLKIQEMLGQAKQMQEQMQQKLAQSVVEASSGGGAVSRAECCGWVRRWHSAACMWRRACRRRTPNRNAAR